VVVLVYKGTRYFWGRRSCSIGSNRSWQEAKNDILFDDISVAILFLIVFRGSPMGFFKKICWAQSPEKRDFV
jgi:hypothetical protein